MHKMPCPRRVPYDQLELTTRMKEANKKILSNLSFQAGQLCSQKKKKSLDFKGQYRIESLWIGAGRYSSPVER